MIHGSERFVPEGVERSQFTLLPEGYGPEQFSVDMKTLYEDERYTVRYNMAFERIEAFLVRLHKKSERPCAEGDLTRMANESNEYDQVFMARPTSDRQLFRPILLDKETFVRLGSPAHIRVRIEAV